MAFFDLIPEEQMVPEARECIDILKRRARSDRILAMFYACAQHPPLLKAWVHANQHLIPLPNRFGAAQHVAGMLISHAKGCRACFKASRHTLANLGLDEAALDAMCRAPESLPLSDRDRRVVEFTLRVARDPEGLKPGDLQEMVRAGFTKAEILEMMGIAAWWNFATTLAGAVDAGLQEE